VADILPEKWMKVMTVTVTVMTVIASIGLSRATFYISKVQFLTAQEEDQWAYFEAKSIKQDLFLVQEKAFQADLLGATNPEQKDLLNRAMQDFPNIITRYEQEKTDIKKKADDMNKQNVIGARRGSQFSLAVVLAQIGIMLSAVGVLLTRREMWMMGLVMGVFSLFFIVNGFLLF
jgi:hypothetical protein